MAEPDSPRSPISTIPFLSAAQYSPDTPRGLPLSPPSPISTPRSSKTRSRLRARNNVAAPLNNSQRSLLLPPPPSPLATPELEHSFQCSTDTKRGLAFSPLSWTSTPRPSKTRSRLRAGNTVAAHPLSNSQHSLLLPRSPSPLATPELEKSRLLLQDIPLFSSFQCSPDTPRELAFSPLSWTSTPRPSKTRSRLRVGNKVAANPLNNSQHSLLLPRDRLPLAAPEPEKSLSLLQNPSHLEQQFLRKLLAGAAVVEPDAQHHRQALLLTTDGEPAGYDSKFEDLHPESQRILLQLEAWIHEHKDESYRLDRCSRLFGSSVLIDAFELRSNRTFKELGVIGAAIERQRVLLQESFTFVKRMLFDALIVVQSFMLLRQFFFENVTVGHTSHENMWSVAFISGFNNGVPKKPSTFMVNTVARQEMCLNEIYQCVEHLHQMLMNDTRMTLTDVSKALPIIISNTHDFFIYIVSKVERLHHCIESMKEAYLAYQHLISIKQGK